MLKLKRPHGDGPVHVNVDQILYVQRAEKESFDGVEIYFADAVLTVVGDLTEIVEEIEKYRGRTERAVVISGFNGEEILATNGERIVQLVREAMKDGKLQK